jgi:hypothetical protein
MSLTNAHFYKNLFSQVGPLKQLITKASCFTDVPDSWHILVTDVENSTAIFEKGNQQLVHLAATGSIVACLNIARAQGIAIPFFFGGDGATLLVPDSLKDACLHALGLHQERCAVNFNFHLRVGSRQVRELKQDGATIKIAKYKRNEFHIMPLVLGSGLKIAEQQIKESTNLLKPGVNPPFNLDLTGMECKWDKVKPPQETQEVLSLIINAVNEHEQQPVFGEVLDFIDTIYGPDESRNPISTERLHMVNSVQQLRNEVQMKVGNVAFVSLIKSFFRSVTGRFYLAFTIKGKHYLKEMVDLTETLMIDGSINTVITGTAPQREELLDKLNVLEKRGVLNYGYHISQRSVISCYVTGTDEYHIHFLDGEDGGYTRASKILKKKVS